MANATEKQISYAITLMAKAGFDSHWMGPEHRKLGATMRERSGKVENWLAAMDRQRISELIEELKSRIG